MLGGEDGFEIWQIGGQSITEGESIQRREIDLGDQEVAAAVCIDPLDDGIGLGSYAWSGFAEGNECLRECGGDFGIAECYEGFHCGWLER
jgi:hypothetical protein